MNQKVSHIMTIANSIIGVGILAMPYCFKQCGILLSIFILIASSTVSRFSSHLLLKSAIIARRKTFENLAFYVFGPLGKLIIELGIIGFLLGTCIAFFVVMGDLGPAIIAKVSGTNTTDTIRTSLLMALALFCVLPLGLLRNVDSLTSVSTASVGFYFCLVLKVITEASSHIFSDDWMSKVVFWRPAGILQCLPIFTMALFCQTQIFEIYQAIPNASLDRMNELIRVAVNICTGVYIFVGIFGYIAFCNQPFTGNILMSFTPSVVTDAITIGFVLSLAFSFPLIIFPCRASLYSLLYKQVHVSHEATRNYIPEGKFKFLTFIIVFISLVTGVLIPNIELVLGLVGSTIGLMICVIFPATCFICMSVKNTNERLAAQVMLFIGILVMVMGTYANIYAIEQTNVNLNKNIESVVVKTVKEEIPVNNIETENIPSIKLPAEPPVKIEEPKKVIESDSKLSPSLIEIRREPPQPVEPEDTPKKEPQQIQVLDKVPLVSELDQKNISLNDKKDVKEIKLDLAEKIKKTEDKKDEIDSDAIKREEIELKEQNNEKINDEKRDNLAILKSLEESQVVQQKLLETQKEILGQIKQKEMKKEKEETASAKQDEIKKAVKEIENIAKKAIESLSNNAKIDNYNNVEEQEKEENETLKKKSNDESKKNVEEEVKKVKDKIQNISKIVESLPIENSKSRQEYKIKNIDNKIITPQEIKRDPELTVMKTEINIQEAKSEDEQNPVINNKPSVKEILKKTKVKNENQSYKMDKNSEHEQLPKVLNEKSNQSQVNYESKPSGDLKHQNKLKDNEDNVKANIVPMPLVNTQIYKNNMNGKGIVPLINKRSDDNLDENIGERNILDVLKGPYKEKLEETDQKERILHRETREIKFDNEICNKDENVEAIKTKTNYKGENSFEKILLQTFSTETSLVGDIKLPHLNDINLLANNMVKNEVRKK